MKPFSCWGIATVMMLSAVALTARAHDCQIQNRQAPLNLTIPLTVQLPDIAGTAAIGTVLSVNEKTLAQLTGSHHAIAPACQGEVQRILNGRMSTAQSGDHIYSTSLPGVGVRITVIYDQPARAKKEWVLPFNTPFSEVPTHPLSTDDIKLRIEAIKTGIIQGGTMTIRLPSLVSLNDNSLVVNLAMTVLAARAHCEILVDQPQIELPPINVKDLASSMAKQNYPVGVNLQCMNTTRASMNIEGATEPQNVTVFKNVAPENPASGVGIEMLYNGSVMTPFQPIDMALPVQQMNIPVPLSVRYAKTDQPVSEGKVKAQITLRINYL
ncbi:fimbrial protein [Lelliottia wanjuensis]|uniref:fimbrial protein n=1 Tax=Lelliottia wanjuensis TaxID=3050585 RepID=UPI002549FA53|nr:MULTISPECIES: fimbrial protein [unclassified Lelliottia]MDK9355397.1 fimbrial protein [Lelliottia sp. V106_16]MDK9375245.1 fimbrial protein [Lelliottia sp. V106_10]MDK9583482.1 fimbrial protein [Lelliottia sp. V86_10]MDK9601150.1 fimbrial protein [Lelliottia sp. V106_5]